MIDAAALLVRFLCESEGLEVEGNCDTGVRSSELALSVESCF